MLQHIYSGTRDRMLSHQARLNIGKIAEEFAGELVTLSDLTVSCKYAYAAYCHMARACNLFRLSIASWSSSALLSLDGFPHVFTTVLTLSASFCLSEAFTSNLEMASKNELMEGKSAMAADVELEPLTSNTQALRRVEPSITEAKNNPVDPARQHLVYHLRLWYFELGAAVFSLLCILAVTIVLHDLDGTLLDAWSLSISPNALVSFIATLAKSSLLLVLAEVISQLKWMHFTSNESRQLSDMEVLSALHSGENLTDHLLALQ